MKSGPRGDSLPRDFPCLRIMGEYDELLIYEAANEMATFTAVLSAVSPGHLMTTKTTVLFYDGAGNRSDARGRGPDVPETTTELITRYQEAYGDHRIA